MVFELFFRNVNGIWLSFFTSKYVDSNAVPFLNFIIPFLRYWKPDPFIAQSSYELPFNFSNSLRVFLLWIEVSNMTSSKAFIIFVLYVDQSFFCVPKLHW